MVAVFLAFALSQAEAPPPQSPVPPPAGRAWWWAAPPGTTPPIFPSHAWIHHIEGFALIACQVTAGGELTACHTLEERPKGEEFGKAALKAMKYYRARPLVRDGLPVDGGTVQIPITFSYRR